MNIDVGDAIPKYTLIFIDTPLPYEFTSIQITFNNTKPVILTDMKRLREAAYRNGMNKTRKNYSVISNNEFGFALGGSTSVPRCRDVLLLELGSDIPLESMMVPGLTNKSVKMSYVVEVNFNTTVRGIPMIMPGDSRLNYEAQFIHMTEQEYVISSNKAENRTSLFTQDDVIKSITSMENTILGNRIRSSRAKLQGGNIFDMFSKLKSVVPKILTGVNTAANVASNVAGTVGQVADIAKAVTGGSGRLVGTAGPVQVPMRQLLMGHR